MAGHQARHPVTSHRDASPLQGAPHLARALRPGIAVRVPRTGTAADRSASVEPTWPGRPFRTLIRTLKPVGIPWIWPEPTVTTVLSRNPPDVCRDSGMRYQVSSRPILSTNCGFWSRCTLFRTLTVARGGLES
jgi:hypothetical protein